MNYREITPIPPLQPYIKFIWLLDGEEENPAIERVFPDGCMELIFHTGQPFSKLVGEVAVEQSASILVGQLTQALFLQPSKKISVIGVRFKPYGLAAFTNIPAYEITGAELTTRQIWGVEGAHLEEQVNLANSLAAVDIIQDFLLPRLQHTFAAHFDIAGLVQHMNTNSEAEISYFAGLANLGERQFARRFRNVVGISPKEYLKINRFNQVLKLLETGKTGNFSAIAMQCGYYDQAHFIKDFREYTGTTPGGFVQNNKMLVPVV